MKISAHLRSKVLVFLLWNRKRRRKRMKKEKERKHFLTAMLRVSKRCSKYTQLYQMKWKFGQGFPSGPSFPSDEMLILSEWRSRSAWAMLLAISGSKFENNGWGDTQSTECESVVPCAWQRLEAGIIYWLSDGETCAYQPGKPVTQGFNFSERREHMLFGKRQMELP